jgi:Ca-activated chloride channel family protein
MRRVASLVLFFGIIAPLTAQAQNQSSKADPSRDDVVRVDTTLVTVPIRVMDRHGKLVPGLKQEQFHIYEDGVEQEIAYFEPPAMANDASPDAAQKPFTVALLLDVSDSTEFKLAQIRNAALAFINLLRPEDRVIVVAFDERVQVLSKATNDRKVLREAIVGTRTGGGTSLYAALDTVISQHLSRVAGRKAIVLLTDGVDTSSKGATAESIIRAAQASDATIYPIQYDTYGDFADNSSRETYGAGDFGATAHRTKNGEAASEAYKRATLFLRLLADKTSGYFQYTDSVKNLSRSFERIAAQLRQQYTLGYYPKNKTADGAQRLIKVEVESPRVTVQTRKSYTYKPRKN